MPERNSPQRLDDLSHLFFSNAETDRKGDPESGSPHPAPRGDHPRPSHFHHRSWSPEQLRKRLASGGRRLFGTKRIVDEEMWEAMGTDLVLADDEGNPVLLVILRDKPETIPFKILNLQAEWKKCEHLIIRAFPLFDHRNLGHPGILFLAHFYPKAVIRAVAAMERKKITLFQVQRARIGADPGLLIQEIYPAAGGSRSGAFYPDPPETGEKGSESFH